MNALRTEDHRINLVPAVPLALVREPRRYDVTLSRAMPARWAERLAGYFWFWTIELDRCPVASGFAWTEHQAERKAALAARRHATPPARARHTPPRTYSINL